MKKIIIGLLSCLMVFSCATACGPFLTLPDSGNSSISDSTNESISNSEDASSAPSDDTASDEPSSESSIEDSSNSVVPELYTLTLRNGNPMLGGTSETSEVAEGTTLELPTLTETGKEFLGWKAMDEEGNLINAPATMPADDLALYAAWNVIPYTVSIVNGEETSSFTFGVEAVEGSVDCPVASVAWNLASYLPENTDSTVYTWAEEVPETFELQNYTFTVVANPLYTLTLRNGNPMIDGTSESLKLVEGATLELSDLSADGKEFLGWKAMDAEGNLVDAPTTMPAKDLALYATWNVIPYTVTIVNGEATSSFTFGVETVEGIDCTVEAVAWNLASYLPEDTIEVLYSWKEEIPAEFTLQNYTFTVVAEAAPTYVLTLKKGDTDETLNMFAGATIELPALTATGKEFLGWKAMNAENNLVDVPAVMPAETLTLVAIWKVIPYTVTITNGDTTSSFTFGIEAAEGIDCTVDAVASKLASYLPEDTDMVTYSWEEEIPAEFTLQNYNFAIKSITTLSIPEALALGAQQADDAYTSESYYVNGVIVKIDNSTFGNVWIADAAGNLIYVFGLSQNGIRYDAMPQKPAIGDYVKLRSNVGNYKNNPQLANAEMISFQVANPVEDCYKNIIETFNISFADVTEAGDVSVPTAGTNYTEVAISWASSDSSIATVSGGTITYTLPAEATTITLTATFTCGEATLTKEYTVNVSAAPAGNEVTVNVIFGDDNLKGEQYVDESYTINENLTISSHNSGCWFSTQLRIMDSADNDGWVILTCTGAVSFFSMNAGYKKCDLLVYGSTDGVTWEEAGTITVSSTSYLDYELDIDESKGYTYLKLDASGAQLRLKNLSVSMLG